MSGGSMMKEQQAHSRHLPPPDVWRHDPERDGLLPTPVDERGLVDVRQLISLMRSTVEPSYDWSSDFADEHHLQWPNRWYGTPFDEDMTEQVFRNLPISKVRFPRVLHNWVHRTTEPPEKPSREVMEYQIAAQQAALSLFRVVRQPKRTARYNHYDQEAVEQMLSEKFDTFASTFERAKQLPKEFHLINHEQHPLRDVADMMRIGAIMGRYAFTAAPTRLIQGIAA